MGSGNNSAIFCRSWFICSGRCYLPQGRRLWVKQRTFSIIAVATANIRSFYVSIYLSSSIIIRVHISFFLYSQLKSSFYILDMDSIFQRAYSMTKKIFKKDIKTFLSYSTVVPRAWCYFYPGTLLTIREYAGQKDFLPACAQFLPARALFLSHKMKF